MKIARTLARTGRSMKNLEIMATSLRLRRGTGCGCGGRRRYALHVRVDLLARHGALRPAHHDPLVSAEPALDDAQLTDGRADHNLALLDHVVLVDDQHVAAGLVAADR